MKKDERMVLVRQGLGVKRFHTSPVVLVGETVGHHTCGVIANLFYLYDNKPPVELVRLALYHDIPEAMLGDVPATAKWDFPKLKEAIKEAEEEIIRAAEMKVHGLSELDLWLLKYADMMDLVYKTLQEVYAGNKFMGEIAGNGMVFCSDLLKGILKDHQPAHDLWTHFTGAPHASKQTPSSRDPLQYN